MKLKQNDKEKVDGKSALGRTTQSESAGVV